MALRRYHGLSNNHRGLQVRTLKDVEGKVIIVGDVHGCVDEFNALVVKCDYDREAGDVLILVGDYVNKGYDSIGVVRRSIELGAYGVMGNHDFTLVQIAESLSNGLQREVLQQQITGKLGKPDKVVELATAMPHECITYLRQLPHIIRIPQHNAIVVHAGINVTLPLEAQEVFDVMHIRTLLEGRDGIVRGSYGSKGQLWAELYEGPEQIIFGHDAKTGLRQYKHAIGIDSGCVYGKSLTAVVFSPNKPGKGQLVQVPSQFNASAEQNPVEGESPAPLKYNTHAIEKEIKKGFGSLPSPALMAAASASTAVLTRPIDSAYTFDTLESTSSQADTKGSLSVMAATVKALIQAGMVDALVVLNQVPAYAERWEDLITSEDIGLGKAEWVELLGKLFKIIGNFTGEEAQLAAYLNMITDILDGVGAEEDEVQALSDEAHYACDKVKRRYPSLSRLVKQVTLAL
eukprot:GILI01012989.1.p1 GENE.GILI01012989.1~~GILI01012989.1.p1  ORF type:complete len:479 (+),score=122.09 GILI01012989.1:58-1437(+)